MVTTEGNILTSEMKNKNLYECCLFWLGQLCYCPQQWGSVALKSTEGCLHSTHQMKTPVRRRISWMEMRCEALCWRWLLPECTKSVCQTALIHGNHRLLPFCRTCFSCNKLQPLQFVTIIQAQHKLNPQLSVNKHTHTHMLHPPLTEKLPNKNKTLLYNTSLHNVCKVELTPPTSNTSNWAKFEVPAGSLTSPPPGQKRFYTRNPPECRPILL